MRHAISILLLATWIWFVVFIAYPWAKSRNGERTKPNRYYPARTDDFIETVVPVL